MRGSIFILALLVSCFLTACATAPEPAVNALSSPDTVLAERTVAPTPTPVPTFPTPLVAAPTPVEKAASKPVKTTKPASIPKPTPVPTPTPTPEVKEATETAKKEALNGFNAARAAARVPKLKPNTALMGEAAKHAAIMAWEHRKTKHTFVDADAEAAAVVSGKFNPYQVGYDLAQDNGLDDDPKLRYFGVGIFMCEGKAYVCFTVSD